MVAQVEVGFEAAVVFGSVLAGGLTTTNVKVGCTILFKVAFHLEVFREVTK